MFNTTPRLQFCVATATLGALFFSSCAVPPNGLAESRNAWDDARDQYAYPREDPSVPEATDAEAPETLEQALHLVLLRNPGLARAFELWRASFEEVTIAQKLPEPQLSIATFVREVETRVGPMDGKLALRQSYPWFGVLELKGDQALARSEAIRERLESVRLDLELKLRETWFELIYLGEAISVTKAHIQLVDHWESVARTRYESNLAQQSDLIRVQIELGRLADRLQTLEDRRSPLQSRIAAMMDLPAEELAGLRPGLDQLPGEEGSDLEEIKRNLLFTNPDLRALSHEAKAADLGRDLADKAFFPKFSIGADYTFVGDAVNSVTGSGDDALAFSLGLTVPIWRKAYRAGQRKAESMARGTRLAQEGLLNELEARLDDLAFQMRDSARRIGLYRDNLIPKGEEALASLDSGYQVGRSNYIDLVDAERVLFEFQLQLARASVDRSLSLARIERLAGSPRVATEHESTNSQEN
jgi:outer membrane protein TolC